MCDGTTTGARQGGNVSYSYEAVRCKADRQGLASEALDTPRSTSASMTIDRVNDRWSTRSGVRDSAPDIAVGGSDRRHDGHQREVRPV